MRDRSVVLRIFRIKANFDWVYAGPTCRQVMRHVCTNESRSPGIHTGSATRNRQTTPSLFHIHLFILWGSICNVTPPDWPVCNTTLVSCRCSAECKVGYHRVLCLTEPHGPYHPPQNQDLVDVGVPAEALDYGGHLARLDGALFKWESGMPSTGSTSLYSGPGPYPDSGPLTFL